MDEIIINNDILPTEPNMEEPNKNNENKPLNIIKSIKSTKEWYSDDERNILLGAGTFMTGVLGLATLNDPKIVYRGQSGDATALFGVLTAVFGILTLVLLKEYIKEKTREHKAIKAIRQESGMTKEQQKEVLEELARAGDPEGIALFDFFYGEKKRKKL